MSLTFLPARQDGAPAGLVRATAVGLEVWRVGGGGGAPFAAAAVLPLPCGGPLTALALVPADDGEDASHLLLVGRGDGGVATARASLSGVDGDAAAAPPSLTWTGYELSAAVDFGGASGAVAALATARAPGGPACLLAAHAGCGVTVWDLPRQAALAACEADVTAVAWVTAGRAFATGHADGRVQGWRLGGRAGGPKGAPPPAATPLWRVDSPPAGPGPVRALLPLGPAALAVWGTSTAFPCEEDEPPGSRASSPASPPSPGPEVCLLSGDLASASASPFTRTPAPWFGPVQGVVTTGPPCEADGTAPLPSLLVLSAGGQVLAHDPGAALAPAPVGLPAQALPEVTACVLLAGRGDRPFLAPYLAASASRGVTPASAGWRVPLPAWRAAASGTGPPLPPPPPPPPSSSSLLFSGHVDGRLRVWAVPSRPVTAAWSGPILVDASPWGGGSGRPPRPVTALAAAPRLGLAATGHARGSACLHQWSALPRRVGVVELGLGGAGGGGGCGLTAADELPPLQPAGWQCVAVVEAGAGGGAPPPLRPRPPTHRPP